MQKHNLTQKLNLFRQNTKNKYLFKIFNNFLLTTAEISNLNKFKTMVQDISLKLSKTVNFSVSGADVTLDKDAFNLLQDGIIHILRNCLDNCMSSFCKSMFLTLRQA